MKYLETAKVVAMGLAGIAIYILLGRLFDRSTVVPTATVRQREDGDRP